MNPRYAFFFKLAAAILFILALALLFAPVMKFVEMAARELRYFWWLVLLVALAVWLIWGLGRKPKQ
ncbi:MAG: hypothetical protein RLZZ350_1989 [Verrucomicrobiota bacterium]|jgi:hypothetical protein